MHRVDQMFAYVAYDEDGEYIATTPVGGIEAPLVGAGRARMRDLKEFAQELADRDARPVRLCVFERRRDLAVLRPRVRRRIQRVSSW